MLQRQQWPTGDAFIVQTPALDRSSSLLYNQFQQRQSQLQQENRNMDGELMKQLGNVKNVDVPDINEAWGKYKAAKQNVLFNKELLRDPNEYAKAQIAANEALGNVMQKINDSKENKDMLTGMSKDRSAHPNAYSDDFGTSYTKAMNTKSSDLGDLRNPDQYRWQGPNTDFQKIFKAAAGTPQKRYEQVDKYNDVQDIVKGYKYGASPAEFYQNVMGSLGNHAAARDAERLLPSQDELDRVDQEYDNIPLDKWQQMTGQPIRQQLPEAITPAQKFAEYHAKLHAISESPTEESPLYRTNQEAKLNLQNQLSTQKGMLLENLRNGHIRSREDYRHQLKQLDEGSQAEGVNGLLQNIEEKAKKNTAPLTIDGKQVGAREVNSSLVTNLLKTKDDQGHDRIPNSVRILDNGDYMGIFYQTNEDGTLKEANGKYLISKSIAPIKVSRDEMLAKLGHELLTKKEAGKELPKSDQTIDVESLRHKYGY